MLFLPKPYSCHLQWHITEDCNFHCKHCYRNEEYIKTELSTDECFKVIDNWVDFCVKTDIKQHRNLTLTGGEPILKKDYWKILDYISSYKKKGLIDRFYIMTNGSTVTDKILQRYKELGVNYMQISVEGMEEVNDSIRGKGNFKKAINGAKLIIKHGMPLSFSLTLTRHNIKEVEPLARLAAEIGVSGLGVGRLVPIGLGSQMKDLILTPEETREWYLECEQINERLRMDGINFRVDYHCSDGIYNTIRPGATNPQTAHGCSTPFDVFTLLPNGDVVPCRRLPIVVGNIREKSFLEIYYSSNKLWNLKNWDNRSEECKSCKFLRVCRGSGKCIAYGYFGTPYAPDPGCWNSFKSKGFPEKKSYPKNPDSDKITYFKRYINNLRFDLKPVADSELKKRIRKIKIDKLDKVKDKEVDVLVFEFEEKDLKPETGHKILLFLDNLKRKKVKFRIGHSLPPCIFDLETKKKFNHSMPNNCFECPNMFRVENKRIIFCNGRIGPDLKFMNNKEQIHEYVQLLKSYDLPLLFEKCRNCQYRIRGTCFYIKNCMLKPKKRVEEKSEVENSKS